MQQYRKKVTQRLRWVQQVVTGLEGRVPGRQLYQ